MKPVIHKEMEPEIVSRITEMLMKQGKTQKSLLEHLGLHRNNYSEWKARRNKSYLLYIDDISRFFNVSPTFLLRGVEDKDEIVFSKEEKELIQMYRQLHQNSKGKLMETAKVLVNLEGKRCSTT